jgi:urease accessory protein
LDFPNLTTPSGWHGKIDLTFVHSANGTQLVHCQGQAPLKVQRPFYPEGEEVCHTVVLHTAGGVVGGDRLSVDLHLQPQAQALITTAAAAKIYRSNGQQARQRVQISVAEAACLEWLPQETIVFDQALYRQDMRVDLAPGALWLGWESTRFGRSARGEQFTQGDWRSHTEVWQEGVPLWCDRQWLPASEELFHSPHGLAGCPVVGSFAFVGQSVEPELVQKARHLWMAEAGGNASSGEAGVTRLQSGLLCRYRGQSTLQVRRWFVEVWQLIRQSYLQRPACIPRVWQSEQSQQMR